MERLSPLWRLKYHTSYIEKGPQSVSFIEKVFSLFSVSVIGGFTGMKFPRGVYVFMSIYYVHLMMVAISCIKILNVIKVLIADLTVGIKVKNTKLE